MTNNFIFTCSKKDLLSYRGPAFINLMVENASKLGIGVSSGEENSWLANFKAIKELLKNSGIHDDTMIGFEYLVPTGGRIDCMLFGEGDDGQKNAVHIELKQWSNANVDLGFSGYTLNVSGYKSGANFVAHPCMQVFEYHNHLVHHIDELGKKNNPIQLYGFAYCYNYKRNQQPCHLFDLSFNGLLQKNDLYCEDTKQGFAKKLAQLLSQGNGQNVMNQILNSKIGPTPRLYDVAANMLNGAPKFDLIQEQQDVFQQVMGAINNTKDNEKSVIIVKGGPGTGKSVLAIRILSECYKNQLSAYYATRSTSLLNGFRNQLTQMAIKNGSGTADSLIRSVFDFKPYRNSYKENGNDVLIIDEAHRISKSANDETDKNREGTYLPQILAMLYTSRISILFIDDKQSIRSSEIGTSNEIEEFARNYCKKIREEENRFFKGKGNSNNKTRQYFERQKNKYSQKNNSDEIKKYNAADRASKWKKIETSINQNDIKVFSFELVSQFRCDGSNGYLEWIDDVLYKTKETKISHKFSDYEFRICETPDELYSAIREKDEYARAENAEKAKLGSSFTYTKFAEKIRRDNKEPTQRARLVAGWCWPWTSNEDKKKGRPVLQENGDLIYDVTFDYYTKDKVKHTFSMPWETQGKGPKAQNDFTYKYAKDADSWLNVPQGVNQVGCIHSAQGWEVDYVGVIIAGDIAYDKENGCLRVNEKTKNYDRYVSRKNRDLLTRNIYRVLMTRGKKGCFIYAVDPDVREYFRKCMNFSNENNGEGNI